MAQDHEGIKYDEEYISSPRGIKQFTCRWLPEDRKPKALIFICHGYSVECSITMKGTATRLANAGYAVYGIDYEGHGKSSGLQGYIPSFDGLVDDVSVYFKSVCEREENRKMNRFLLGESMGGAVVLQLHKKEPNYWDGAVLVAPMCKIADKMKPHPIIITIFNKLTKIIPTWKITPTKDLANLAIKDPEVRKKLRANPYIYKGKPRLKTAHELLMVSLDIEKNLNQIEMSEVRSVVAGATRRSLVLVDEICRGTETAKGTCIAGSIVETLDQLGCLGIVSTHLHGIFDLPLATKNTVYKAMGTENLDGHVRPTWKLIDGVCRESLAFETAQKEGIPEKIIRRAEELYLTMNTSNVSSTTVGTNKEHLNSRSRAQNLIDDHDSLRAGLSSSGITLELQKKVEIAVTIICQKKLNELHKKKTVSELPGVTCVAIGAREQPPPSTVGASSIYILFRPDKKLYVGQTDDLVGRIRAHRSKEGMQNIQFLYVVVPGKSIASQLETLLINQLPLQGFKIINRADGKHRNFGTSCPSLETLSLHQ